MATQTVPEAGTGQGPALNLEAPPSASQGNAPPRRLILGVAAVVVLLALVFGVRWLLFATTHETTDDAKIDTDQITVTSKLSERVAQVLVSADQPVHKGQLLVRLDDTDESQRVTSARATRDAQLASLHAAEATLALTRDQVDAQQQQSRGGVAQARAAVTSASEQARAQNDQIAVSQAGIDAAQAQLRAAQDGVPAAAENLRKAQADLARVESLVASGDIARAQLDAARAASASAQSLYSQAQANVAAAQANVASARQRLVAQRSLTDSSQAQIGVQVGSLATAEGRLAEVASPSRVTAVQASVEGARAQLAMAQAQLATAEQQLANTRITAPVDGHVGAKNIEVGQTVAPGQSLLAVIPENNIYVTANFKETQLGAIKAGMPVEITVDAYKGVDFKGHVASISPASQNTFSIIPAQNATGNFVKVTQRVPVRILFDDPDPAYALRPGMSVETAVKVK
jgi:membrane fusion protein (multidrug efflux system)